MSRRFEVSDGPLAGLTLLRRLRLGDDRGWLERLYCDDELRAVLGDRRIVQVNRTLTRQRGAVRGMHFQHAPHAEAKVITCLRGRVFDVAVDVRRGSPTFLKWHAEILDGTGETTFVIPEGFAHGFQALEPDSELLYFHTARYQADAEGALNAADPSLAIAWPLEIAERSERDRAHPMIGRDFAGARL